MANDDMKVEDKTIHQSSSAPGTFGAMSREQLLAMTKNPPKAAAFRDPFANRPTLSEVQANQQLRTNLEMAAAGLPQGHKSTIRVLAAGARAYHRKHKEECTVLGPVEGKADMVYVGWDSGGKSKAKIENLTAL